MTNAPTPRETADHAELARLAEAAEPYWHAANLACGGNPIAVDLVAPFVGAMSPAVCSALLSEIAALRGEVERVEANHDIWVEIAEERLARATQAERQRDEAVGLLLPFAERCDEAVRQDDSDNDGVTVKTRFLRAARTFLANQGAD